MKKNRVKYLFFCLLLPIFCVFAFIGCGVLGTDGGNTSQPKQCKHITQYVSPVVMTCDQDGYKQHYKCQLCGKLFEDKAATKPIVREDMLIPRKHSTREMTEKPATCTEAGHVAGWQCTMCFNYFEDRDGEIAIPREDAIYAKLPHDYTDYDEIPPTCTERGRTPGRRCSVCGETVSGSNWIPIIDHIFKNDVCTMCHVARFAIDIQYEPIYGIVNDNAVAVAYKVKGVELKSPRRVEIPAEYDGLPVTEIAEEAFKQNENITSVKIPASVTSMGSGAFYGCSALTSAEFEEGSKITSLPYNCFRECNALNSCNIPDTVKTIYSGAFYGCTLLDITSLPESIEKIESYAFKKCENMGDITVPQTVTEIGSEAFAECKYAVIRCEANMPSGYKSDMAPDIPVVWSCKTNDVSSNGYIYATVNGIRYQLSGGIASVLGYRRADAAGITELNIPVSVTYRGGEYAVKYVEDKPFLYCADLKKLSFEKGIGINTFPRYMLTGCSSLEELTLPFAGSGNNRPNYKEEDILAYLFARDPSAGWYNVRSKYGATGGYVSCYAPFSLKKVTVFGGKIYTGCFAGFSSLETAVVDPSILSTDDGIFSENKSLISISVPGGKKLSALFATDNFTGSYSIKGDSASKYHYIPNTLSSVEITRGGIVNEMFAGFKNIESVTLPATVAEIGARAFSGCESITSITLPQTVTGIGNDAFTGCTGLTEVYTPSVANWFGITFANVESNPLYFAHALYVNGEKLTDIVLPSGITELPAYVYAGFDGGENLVLPSGITKINAGAFTNCPSLKSITVPAGVNEITRGAFSGCDGLEEITLPFIGTRSDGTGDRELKYIFGTVPESLKTVNVTGTTLWDYAFRDCEYITEINLAANTTAIPDSAFFGCESLTSIDLTGVESIDRYAFRNSGLINVVLPESLTSIGISAFAGCDRLRTFTTPFVGAAKNAAAASETTLFGYYFGQSGYSSATGTKQYYSNSNYRWSEIPDTLEKITVTGGKIFYGTFSGLKNVGEIVLGENVTELGEYMIKDCYNLHTVKVDASSPSVHPNVFNEGGPAIAYFIGSGVTQYAVPTVYNYATNGTDADGYTYARVNGVTYGFKNGDATVYRQPSKTEHCIIPDTVKYNGADYTVRSICDQAFKNCTLLTEAYIPYTVTSMGISVFEGCFNITKATLPFIGSNSTTPLTFAELWGIASNYSAYNLTELTVTGLTEIKNEAFKNCNKLEKIDIQNASRVGASAFEGCSKLAELSIAGNVGEISEGALKNCTGLQKLTLPYVGRYANASVASAETLFAYAFGRQTSSSGSMYTVNQYFGDNTIIDNRYTSALPISLTEVIITGGKLNYGAFYGITKVTSVILGGSITDIGDYAFYNCLALDIVLPASIRTIGAHAFDGAKNSRALALTNIESIGEYAFRGNGFTSAVLPSTLAAISEGMFQNCKKLASVTVPTEITAIGEKAFMGCSALRTFAVPEQVTSIGSYAFAGSGLTAFALPDGFTTVPAGLLSYCEALASVELPSSGLTAIGAFAFESTGLTSVTVPAGVTVIPEGVFYNCKSLSGVTFVEDITDIGKNAFRGCSALRQIDITAALARLRESAFESSGLRQITIPGGSNFEIGNYAFRNCKSLTSITATVKSVGDSAFFGCTALSTCTLSGSYGISVSAFEGCSALHAFNFTNVTSLNQRCFAGSGLININLGTLSVVPMSAFEGCTGLRAATMVNVEIVYKRAFYQCTKLALVSFGETDTAIVLQKLDEEAFASCNIREISLGGNITEIGLRAFAGNTNLSTVHFNISGNVEWTRRTSSGMTGTVRTSNIDAGSLGSSTNNYSLKR